jgi:hypothetical protein
MGMDNCYNCEVHDICMRWRKPALYGVKKELGCDKHFKRSVDAVEVVHGRWVNAAGCRTICNHCGEYPLYDYWGKLKFSAYCPNCGAKMDGERKAQ